MFEENGFGKIVTREKMIEDKVIPYNHCTNVLMKPPMEYVPDSFYDFVSDKECDAKMYDYYYKFKVTDPIVKKMIKRYHPYREVIALDMSDVETDTAIVPSHSPAVKIRRRKRQGPLIRTALDDLTQYTPGGTKGMS